MSSLIQDLKTTQSTLDGFFDVTLRVLNYLPSVVTEARETRGYRILVSTHAGTEKYTRPIRLSLFIFDPAEFSRFAKRFEAILGIASSGRAQPEDAAVVIDRTAYTIQQAMGVGLDLLGESNSSRKHIGNRFEEFIRTVVAAAGIANKKVVFKIPYLSEDDEKMYSCETDMVLTRGKAVKSRQGRIDENEVVVSLKTSSKDRMGKIFLDKLLMEKFMGHPVKVIGIFHNDVQRKSEGDIAYTFVSGLFMVYTQFLCRLEGVYFLDPPPVTEQAPYCEHVASFSTFLLRDVKALMAS